MRQILFVDDEPDVLDGLRNVLRRERGRWRMRFALGGEAALRELDAEPCDVLVSDMRMPGMDGLTLLGLARQRHPAVARIVLSGHADLDAVVRASATAHQYLPKPCDAVALSAAIQRALAVQDLLGRESLRRLVGGLGTLPSGPGVYSALTAALGDPEVDVGRLAAMVTQDVGLATRALQFVNSAYCGLTQRVTSIEAALKLLGLDAMRHLALTVEVFQGFAGSDGEDFAALAQHALLTARIARAVAPRAQDADAVFAAGLLHDAGKLLAMSRAPAEYRAVQEEALRTGAPLEAERRVLGATHAEIGAHLLALWDLPHSIVEPVLHHHDLDRVGTNGLDVLAVVALADALASEVVGGGAECTAAVLQALSPLGDLARWREIACEEARAC